MLQALLAPNSVPVSIRFEDGDGPDLSVRTLDAQFAMSALFTVRLLVTASDPDVPLRSLLDRRVIVELPDGLPLRGLLHRASHSQASGVANAIMLEIGPYAWGFTQRFDEFVWTDSNIEFIASDFMTTGDFAGPFAFELTSVLEPRPQTTQFDETDHDCLFRLLAEDGVASFFDVTPAATTFIFTNDTVASSAKRQRRLPFVPPSQLATAGAPHIHSVELTAQSVIDCVELRDYWFERPEFEACGLAEVQPPSQWKLYDRTRVGAGATDSVLNRRARDVLAGFLAGQELIRLEGNTPLLPGTALTVDGATRPEAAGPLLVLSTQLRWSSQPGEAAITRCHSICMPAAQRFVPPRLPKPKIGGLHTATVVGDGEIDVDPYGQVLCEFNWEDRPWTRRVRVSQGWAGPGYGFVTLPRVGDEVLIAYMDGDPDEPLVVGRVHNGKNLSPITLPAESTVSTWRSKSSPGGNGYNEIRMDDAAGAERLDIHAQRDFSQKVERDLDAWIGRNATVTIDGDKKVTVKGTGDVQFGGPTRFTGPDGEITTADRLALKSNLVQIESGSRVDTTSGLYVHTANQVTYGVAGTFVVTAGQIVLRAGGSHIAISPAGIDISSSGPVNINGAPINLNCK